MVRIHAGQPAFFLFLGRSMNDWQIQSRASECQGCGRKFADQQPYHSLLWAEPGRYRRQDVCPECWEGRFRQQARSRPEVVSFWRGVYEAPPPPQEPIRRDAAEQLLRQLCERGDPQYGSAVYILAIMMERKRLLRVKEQFWRDGRRIFVYEHTRTGDVFTVPDPALKLSELAAVQQQVSELLEHGLPPVEAAMMGEAAPDAPGGFEPSVPSGGSAAS